MTHPTRTILGPKPVVAARVTTCWAIIHTESGRIDIGSLCFTRRDAVAKWSNMEKYPWAYWRKKGWTAAKVQVSAVNPEAPK